MQAPHLRGVFEPHFTGPGNHALLLAVDSKGRLVAHVSVTDPNRHRDIVGAFQGLLDTIDPDARLTLVR